MSADGVNDSGANGPTGGLGQRVIGWSTVTFIVATVVLGGGGASALPGYEAACELAGFGLLALLATTGNGVRIDRAAIPWLTVAILAFLLPLGQMVPLPREVLESLPGRELANAIRSEAGGAGSAPFSLDPDRTMLSALTLIPALAMFIATLRSSHLWRERLIVAWLAMGAVTILVGALQVSSGGQVLDFYNSPHREAATGFFANRNHNAIFLLAVLVLFAANFLDRGLDKGRIGMPLRLGVVALLCAGIFTTTSRAGLVLLVLASPFLFLLVRRASRVSRIGWQVPAGLLAALVAITVFVVLNPVAQEVTGRFTFAGDPRFVFWPDAVATLRQFWPAGSGFGTFAQVFASQEQLESIGRLYVNHAHNDFLELAIEGGAPAVILMGTFAVLLALRARAIAGSGETIARRLALTGLLGITIILLHSLVDYPLRAITVMTMFAFLAGLLFDPASIDDPGATEPA